MSNPEETCDKCRFTVITHAPMEAQGDQPEQPARYACRRFPPQTHFIVVLRGNPLAGRPPMPMEEQRSSFPPVMPDWNCGEWAPAISLTS